MELKQKMKLERFLRNSSRFFWGLGEDTGNPEMPRQKRNYAWLASAGLVFREGRYVDVIDQLLENPGIGKLVTDIITPRVNALFTEKAKDYLRSCWQGGSVPDLSVLKRLYGNGDPFPFLIVNEQYHHFERWGEFAVVWFEEIEPFMEPSMAHS